MSARSFRERSPLAMGVAGMATVFVLVLIAFNLTLFQRGTGYHAAFTEASGLKPNEPVLIAGVKVGQVKSVSLEGDHVTVGFRINSGVHFGRLSRLQIKIRTILGSHYLELQPQGTGQQPADKEIPVSRTTPSYEVVPALQDLSSQVGKINTAQLSQSLNVVNQALEGTPDNVGRTLSGLQRVSRAISSRDNELNSLLQHSSNVTRLLADRAGDLSKLVSDSSLLLLEINARRTVIHSLLTNTVTLSQQITGLIQENKATLHPALVQTHRLINVLERDQANLEKAINVLGPFVTVSGDATSNGRWFDGYLQNLIPLPASIQQPKQGGSG